MRRTLILGGPGAGKTERLSQILEMELANGVRPERVAFVSFTRAAVTEASERFSKKFSLSRSQTTYFRTLHSLCYWQLGMRRDQVMDSRRMREFGREIGVRMTGFVGDEIPTVEGDRMAFLTGLAPSVDQDLREVWERYGGIEWSNLKWFADSLAAYKRSKGLTDFTDMLTTYATDGPPVDVDVAFVDEAQDLTPVQWLVIARAFEEVDRMYVAGDDDQAIYQWAGADVRRFRTLSVDSTEVLPSSHRLPPEVFSLASGIANRIEDRYEKDWGPAEHSGSIEWVGEVGNLDLSEGEWFLLARNSYLLKRYVDECRSQGVPYVVREDRSVDPEDVRLIEDHERMRRGEPVPDDRVRAVQEAIGLGDPTKIWHEAFEEMPLEKRAYYLTMRRRGERMKGNPRIRIDTIHGVKGKEADNVAMILDVAKRSYEEGQTDPDSELRVLYVGATRAKRNLFLVIPQTTMAFDL